MLPATSASFPYRVIGKAGEGGMGEVYEAEELDLGRRVAIKTLKPALLASMPEASGRALTRRFLDEARAAAALAHPGAVVVYRVGLEAQTPFIAMEWVEGETLERRLEASGRLELDVALRLGIQVLRVLAAAHEKGIVHRDIKPANLLITPDGKVKVADFGIARFIGGASHTQAGIVLGTPHYAAPEQLAGREVDARADVYSVGAVLYEALVERPPHDAADVYELIARVQRRTPLPASVLVPDLPEAVDAVLSRALAKQPAQRYASAAEMAAALEALRADGPAPAATPRVDARARTLAADVPVELLDASTHAALAIELIRRWPMTRPGPARTDALLERLAERPLHAAAFSGAVELHGAYLLFSDGVIQAAFREGETSAADGVIDGLDADSLDPRLHHLPEGLDPRVPALLATLLAPAPPLAREIDGSYADVTAFAASLEASGFDGALTMTQSGAVGASLFARGQRSLDLFAISWPRPRADASPWESAGRGTTAVVRSLKPTYPALAFRHHLRGAMLDVERASGDTPSSLVTDARRQRAVVLRKHALDAERRPPTSATLDAMLEADPTCARARWLLGELAPQFEQYGRAERWRMLLEPLGRVARVRLHHAPVPALPGLRLDLCTYDASGRLLHVLDHARRGDAALVTSFLERATQLKRERAGQDLVGAVLVADGFDDGAVRAYLDGMRARAHFLSALDALSHREAYLRLGAMSGLHVLLVDAADGALRPLVPELA